jgi:hypothetical protein
MIRRLAANSRHWPVLGSVLFLPDTLAKNLRKMLDWLEDCSLGHPSSIRGAVVYGSAAFRARSSSKGGMTMNTIQSETRHLDASTAFRLTLLTAILAFAGCGQHLTGTLRVSEGLGTPQQEGTLILVEVITPLTREQALVQFREADLQAAGLKEADVMLGTAVFVSSYAQRQTALSPAQGLYALVNLNAGSLDSGASTCSQGRCSYGGDAVAIRVAKRPAGGTGEPVLYIVESVVEPSSVKGDCSYVPRGGRRALHCKSLDSKGWEWQGNLFVKRPGATAK